jgi:hypothetical protein
MFSYLDKHLLSTIPPAHDAGTIICFSRNENGSQTDPAWYRTQGYSKAFKARFQESRYWDGPQPVISTTLLNETIAEFPPAANDQK